MIRKPGDIYVDEFIENTILKSAQFLTERIPYAAFGIISVGIEFLGKCLDENVEFDYFKRGLSKKHFDLAINKLMSKYQPANDEYDFQDKLRNGFLHGFRPKSPLWLRDKKSATEPHLSVKDGRIHLIVEELFNDFKQACDIIIVSINNKEFSNQKMYRPYIQTIL